MGQSIRFIIIRFQGRYNRAFLLRGLKKVTLLKIDLFVPRVPEQSYANFGCQVTQTERYLANKDFDIPQNFVGDCVINCPSQGYSSSLLYLHSAKSRAPHHFIALAALRSVPHRKRHLRQAGSQFRLNHFTFAIFDLHFI